MGQQQIILITLCVIVVGTAIAVGLTTFSSNSIAANKDALIEDLSNLAANAKAFFLRPKTAGGGGNSFVGYKIPKKLASTQDGTFELDGLATSTTVKFKAISIEDVGNYMTAELDKSRTQLRFTGFYGEFDDSE
jgi:hypothetical protein